VVLFYIAKSDEPYPENTNNRYHAIDDYRYIPVSEDSIEKLADLLYNIMYKNMHEEFGFLFVNYDFSAKSMTSYTDHMRFKKLSWLERRKFDKQLEQLAQKAASKYNS